MNRIFTAISFGAAILPCAALAAAPDSLANCTSSKDGYTCPIDTISYPDALCNDGSPGVYGFRPSSDGSTTWIVWLQGGGECFNNFSCTQRYNQTTLGVDHYYTTANGFAVGAGAGMLSKSSTENPALYDANTIVVHYCSSDTWSGAKRAVGSTYPSDPSTTWTFEGRALAEAAVASVIKLPNFGGATRLILGGDSAGGEGITVTLNNLLPILPASKKRSDLFVNDAGFALRIGQCDPKAPSPYIYTATPNQPIAFDMGVSDRLKFWNAAGDTHCLADAHTDMQRAACLDSAYVLGNGYIGLPQFVAESQLDTAQLTQELCPSLYGKCPVSHQVTSQPGDSATYADAFASQMKSNVQGSGAQATYWGYSPDQYMHVILSDDTVFTAPLTFPVGGTEESVTPQQALAAWLANPTGPRQVLLGDQPGISGSTLMIKKAHSKAAGVCPGGMEPPSP